MLSLRISRVLAVAALGALAACGADSATGPVSADLSSVLGELSPSSIPGASSTLAMNGVPSTAAIVPSSCSYASASQSFACPSLTVNGLTIGRSFTLLDASGATQSAYDKATTAAVRVNGIVNGTLTGTGATVADTSAMTLSGLLSGAHTLDGTDRAHLNGTSGALATTGPVTVVTTIAGLVLPTRQGGYPAAGTITTAMTITKPAAATNTIKLAFNGTSKVTVTNTSPVSTTTCTLDLANPAAGCI